MSQGTATASLVSPLEFFREALRFGVNTTLAWQNHPSGDPTPSKEDCALTTRLRTAGESLGVPRKDLPPCGCCKRSGFWLGNDGHTYGSDGQEHSSYKAQAQSIGFDR